jgi:hypothetical protein
MDVFEYFVSTLKVSFEKIGSLISLLILGYFLFFKVPFLLFLKNVKKVKEQNDQLKKDERLQINKIQPPRTQRMTEKRARVIFQLKESEVFTQEELKKRYRDLLKMNHPDKVASLSDEFKELAHLKTKEINDAYDLLITFLS